MEMMKLRQGNMHQCNVGPSFLISRHVRCMSSTDMEVSSARLSLLRVPNVRPCFTTMTTSLFIPWSNRYIQAISFSWSTSSLGFKNSYLSQNHNENPTYYYLWPSLPTSTQHTPSRQPAERGDILRDRRRRWDCRSGLSKRCIFITCV